MMTSDSCKVLLILFLLSAKLYIKVSTEFEATPSQYQVFNITCDPHNDSSQDCQSESLETIADKVRENADVEINIEVSWLILTTNISFTKLNSLTISASERTVTTIACNAGGNATNAGMTFIGIMNAVKLNALRLMLCGSQTNKPEGKTYISALTMLRCRNVEINKVVVAKSKGIGLTILYHQGGRVDIQSTIFKENKISQDYSAGSFFGGGGVYIVIDQIKRRVYEPIAFHFDNCTFENNVAHTTKFDFGYTNDEGMVETGYGSGGGAHFSIENGVRDLNVSFSHCNFTANQAFIGGGITIKIYAGVSHNETRNVTFEIRDSLFVRNGCGKTRSGGGAYLSFATYFDGSIITDSHYFVRNVSFIENCAELGGGVFYYSNRGKQGHNDNENNSVLFDNCTFRSNKAHIGSAVEMTTSMFLKVITGYTIVPIFKNCQFLENFVFVNQSQKNQKTAGIGTIYASLYNIRFNGSSHFESNRGTPVYVVNGVVNCTNSDVSFVNNTGLQGGAIALVGSSIMILGRHKYEFINNTAIHEGGAIYVSLTDSTDFFISRSCFIQYLDTDSVVLSANWKANITFMGNKAVDDTAGHAIYATSLHPCQVINNGTSFQPEYILLTNISEVFSVRGINFDDDLSHPQIATDGSFLYTSRETPWTIIPGEKYQHGVTMKDDLNRSVNASLRVAISRKQKDIELNSGFYTFTGSDIQLKGKPDHNASLFIYTVSARQSYIKRNITLLKCPPGFKLTNNGICDCNTNAYIGLFKCDMDKFHSHLHFGYWVGLMETPNGSQDLVTSPCPFCDYSLGTMNSLYYSKLVVLPRDYSNLSETVCGESRNGTVCGRCQNNYTMQFHSPSFQCKAIKSDGCKFGWLFYILSELMPVTLVFIIVLIFNVRFTSGTVNGFILFSQMLHTMDVSASGIIVLPGTIKHSVNYWTEGYQVIYGFFNFDFFNSESLSFCLWKNASALDMLAVKYVTVTYTLLMIVAVIWIMNSCGGRCCGKCCRITTVKTSVIHGISTFLLICYAQCIKVSLYLLMPVYFYVDEGNGFKPPVKVWLNGELTYLGKKHLSYAIPALLFLLIVGILPPALLLAYPLLNKVLTILGCENSRVINFISRLIPTANLKPMLDSIQGCFKDNFRFFAGLYFLYRWTFLLIQMNPSIFNVYYTAVSGVLVFILTLHTICQPYIKRVHNIIDALLFANLLLIALLSSFNYHRSRNQKKTDQEGTVSSSIVQLVLIYLPLVVMGACILITLCKKVIGCGHKILSTHFPNVFIPARVSQLRELVLGVGGTEDDDSELVHERILDESVPCPKYNSVNNSSYLPD